MRKLSFIILLTGLGMLLIVPGAHAQMMGHGNGNSMHGNNSMHNGNSMYDNPQDSSYMMNMSNMMNIEDSLDMQSKMIVAKYDSLEADFEDIMDKNDSKYLEQDLQRHHEKMLALRKNLSHFEETQANLDMKMKSQRIIHSMDRMFGGMFGLGKTEHEEQ